MAADLYSEEVIARYLLGDLPEEQQVEIEDRAFQDKEYLASITAVENDLIDEYVRQELSETDRRRFESRFLASEARRKRVEFAKALSRVSIKEKVVAPARTTSWYESFAAFFRGLAPAPRFALATAMLLLFAAGAWFLFETMRLRGELNRLQAQQQSQQSDRQALQQRMEAERKRSEELAARLSQEQQQREQTDESLRQLSESGEAANPPNPVIASLTLLPGVTRGANQKPKLVLPEDARLVRIKIGIEPTEPYKNFALGLSTVGGRHVWSRERVNARAVRGGRVVALTLPATALKVGEYELRLKGLTETGTAEDVGFYYFEVTKK